MRIAYLLTTLGIGGAEKQVISLAERMSARGHVVTLIVLKHESAEEWPVKLPVLRLNMQKTVSSLRNGLRFASNFLSVFRPDILHSHTFPANIFARLLRMRGAAGAVLNTIHNVYEGRWHRMLLYRLTDRHADQVTAVSAAAAEQFVKLHAVRASKMSVITNGIDIDEFVPDRHRRKSQRKLMHAGESFAWLAVGRIVPAKDYPNLLRAFALVRNEHPEASLWIAGEGDISLLESTEQNKANPGKDTAGVQMLGLRRDIAALLDAADGFVLSSAWEGMPLAAAEAMAMEKSIVATDVGGVRELLNDTGLLVPAKDSESLAQAMLQIMAMTDKQRTSMGLSARDRVRLHFSIEANAAVWEELYLRMVREARP